MNPQIELRKRYFRGDENILPIKVDGKLSREFVDIATYEHNGKQWDYDCYTRIEWDKDFFYLEKRSDI